MSVELNHTIVHAADREISARFMCDVFGLAEPETFGRVQDRGLDYWADPMRSQPGRINTHYGGRGVYFCDPAGHFLEIITKPYGAGPP